MADTATPKQEDADEPRYLAAYGEGELLPRLETEQEREEFEQSQRRGWENRSL